MSSNVYIVLSLDHQFEDDKRYITVSEFVYNTNVGLGEADSETSDPKKVDEGKCLMSLARLVQPKIKNWEGSHLTQVSHVTLYQSAISNERFKMEVLIFVLRSACWWKVADMGEVDAEYVMGHDLMNWLAEIDK
ncbi:hypothetical protein Tco_0210649 [Tanacetum coccineum]